MRHGMSDRRRAILQLTLALMRLRLVDQQDAHDRRDDRHACQGQDDFRANSQSPHPWRQLLRRIYQTAENPRLMLVIAARYESDAARRPLRSLRTITFTPGQRLVQT